MATLIPCSVDTTPMAEEIKSVSKHVMGTTAAVVAMQTAVIAAENSGANKVCSNVNRGFFTLMRSQISQKIANKQSRVEALVMQLAQQKRRLLAIKTNMEREYGRIAERYLKIFTTVNKELETRIRQVDQPVFELVNKHMATSSNRMNALTAWIPTSQKEGITSSQQILVSSMKHNAQTALEQTTGFLEQIGQQRELTRQILISNASGNEDRVCHLPVLVFETVNDENGMSRMEVRTSETFNPNGSESINNALRSSDMLPWSQGQCPSQVADEFSLLMEQSSMKPRVKAMVQKMFSSSEFETM
ncbi:MAG: hypothetical protein J6W75_08900 [Bacteroidaceae bacterium]|nr:hypothetical protein [Bacteroidaceae bacterium]